MARNLSQFTISSQGDGYILHLATEDGGNFDVAATYEQLDLISETIEERLDEDEEEALEVSERD
jgi:hypothetical protein